MFFFLSHVQSVMITIKNETKYMHACMHVSSYSQHKLLNQIDFGLDS